MIVHPVRSTGMFIGVIQSYRNMEKTQDRIARFIASHSKITQERLLELMLETFRFIADYKGEIPGATAKDCGNYLLQDLPMARWEANKYLTEVLEVITDEQLVYPQ